MVYISDSVIESIIKEDMPYYDITTSLLNIGANRGKISYYARNNGVVSGVLVAKKIFEKLGAEVTFFLQDGSSISKDDMILQAKGNADILHAGWKVALNTLEYLSGITSLCSQMVYKSRQVNKNVMLAATRKSMPLTRQLVTLAFLAGGVEPHRLGLSETILIFKQHLEFMGGFENLENTIKNSAQKAYEKKIILETENYDDSIKALQYDFISGIQLDKLSPEEVGKIVDERNKKNKNIKIIAAGGINLKNIEDYAVTMADVLVSSYFFHAAPFDIKAVMEKDK